MTEVTADGLFSRFFWPHYPADVRADYEAALARDANPARNPALIAHWVEAAELFAKNAPKLLATDLTWDAAGVARMSHAMNRARRDAWLAASDPRDPENPFFNAVVHGAAYVGEVIVRAHGGAWSMRRPMWESLVMRRVKDGDATRTTGAIPPFHWLLKHLSDAEIDSGSLAYRFHVHVELATAAIEALPAIASPRKLPTMRAPTYDLLVKYLHQHLPALRDLGTGFPSPADFTARRYETLAFDLFHDGRVLAMHGQVPAAADGQSLVEVLWLTARGFDHADTIPADAGTPSFARATGDTLEVTVAWKGRPHTHRVGFRGHGA
jgi:hypothetical protein